MGGVNPYIQKVEAAKPQKPFTVTFVDEETGKRTAVPVDPAALPGHLGLEGITRGQARITHGLHAGGQSVMDEGVHVAGFLRGDVLLDAEALDLTGEPGGHGRGIELGDAGDAGLARNEIAPGLIDRVAHGGDEAQAGDDDATTGHA